jgi:hypothetical protein
MAEVYDELGLSQVHNFVNVETLKHARSEYIDWCLIVVRTVVIII